jgi:phospholipase/carboxylesterase
MMLTRRGLLVFGLGAGTAGAGIAQKARGGDSVLRVRPHQPTKSVQPGEHTLDLGGDRDGLLIVPQQYRPDKAAPLAVMLHGAGGHARRLALLLSMANSFGVVLLVPESRGTTWDGVRGSYGPDVDFISRALDQTFTRCAVDQRKLAVGGFSDGATYGLSLGLDNGTLFTHVMAFSPGFNAARRPSRVAAHFRLARPLRYHPAHRCHQPPHRPRARGRGLLGDLQDGPHAVPEGIAEDGFRWFVR